MKLILLRHAKTERNAATDWERELTKRGHAQARSLAPTIAAEVTGSALALVSSARRTVQTWGEVGVECASVVTDDLYVFSGDDVAAVLAAHEGQADTIVVVGHNPGISELARRLAGAPPTDQALSKRGELRTCRGVVIELDSLRDLADSAGVSGVSGSAVRWLRPSVD